MDGYKSHLLNIPNEIGIKIASLLDIHALLNLRTTCHRLHSKSPFWFPNVFIHVQHLKEILGHLPKMLDFKSSVDTLRPLILIKVKDYGFVCIHILKSKLEDHSYKVKTLFRKLISTQEALKDILESDPYSFHVYHPVNDSQQFNDYSIGSFASTLRNYLKTHEQMSLISMGLLDKHEDSKEYAPYKHALYPLERHHPFVQSHTIHLLNQGYILRTLVDGTVGVSCQDLLLEFEPPHWQDYLLDKNKTIHLTGKELPIRFMELSHVLDYIKMIQSRWKELYSHFISNSTPIV